MLVYFVIVAALVVAFEHFSLLVRQVVLDVASACRGQRARERDLHLVWLQLFISLLLVDHRVDLFQDRRRLERVLRQSSQLDLLLFQGLGLLNQIENHLHRLLLLLLAHHFLYGFFESGGLLSQLVDLPSQFRIHVVHF